MILLSAKTTIWQLPSFVPSPWCARACVCVYMCACVCVWDRVVLTFECISLWFPLHSCSFQPKKQSLAVNWLGFFVICPNLLAQERGQEEKHIWTDKFDLRQREFKICGKCWQGKMNFSAIKKWWWWLAALVGGGGFKTKNMPQYKTNFFYFFILFYFFFVLFWEKKAFFAFRFLLVCDQNMCNLLKRIPFCSGSRFSTTIN